MFVKNVTDQRTNGPTNKEFLGVGLAGNQQARQFFWNLPGQTCSICCRSISRAGLMICKCRRNFLTTFSKAFSRITCSKSRSCQIYIMFLTTNYPSTLCKLLFIRRWRSSKLFLAQMPRINSFFFNSKNHTGNIIGFQCWKQAFDFEVIFWEIRALILVEEHEDFLQIGHDLFWEQPFVLSADNDVQQFD